MLEKAPVEKVPAASPLPGNAMELSVTPLSCMGLAGVRPWASFMEATWLFCWGRGGVAGLAGQRMGAWQADGYK